jgi:hypothetical protein
VVILGVRGLLGNRGLVIRMALENRTWGCDRIRGALSDLGHRISDQTVGNILRRSQIAPAPERSRAATCSLAQTSSRSKCRPGETHRVLHSVLHRDRQSPGVAGRHFDIPESARAGTTRSSVLHGYATCHETACRIRIARQNALGNQAISLRTEFFAEHSARSANPQRVYRVCREQDRTGRCNLRSMPRIYFFKSQGLWTSPAEAVSL